MAGPSSNANMLTFFTDDHPGIQIGPYGVWIFSMVFIASVIVLHIMGKVVA
jgi:protein transport protein SEC61 subunit beta